MAAQIGHGAFPQDHHGQAGGDGAQDLSVDRQAAQGRTTIAVSRDPAFAAPGVVVAPSLDAALAAARGDALRRGADAIVVAGGADVYAQVLPAATRLVITEVHKSVDGDRRFPVIDPQLWRETWREEHEPAAADEAAFAFVVYERAKAAAMRPPSAA